MKKHEFHMEVIAYDEMSMEQVNEIVEMLERCETRILKKGDKMGVAMASIDFRNYATVKFS